MRNLTVESHDMPRARSAFDGEARAVDLGAEAVRLARIATALHMSQAAALLAVPSVAPALWNSSAESSQ